MKIISYTAALFVFLSCQDSQEIDQKKAGAIKNAPESISAVPLKKSDKNETKSGLEILLPNQYRDWEGENPVNHLTRDWIDLYQENGSYYLGKADFTIERGYSECSGDSTKIIESNNRTLILINDPSLQSGKIKTVKLSKTKIWPGEKMLLKYNNNEYVLRAEGEILSSGKVYTDTGEEMFHQVKDYKLYISTGNSPETLFLEEESFNDTFVELLFAGDIDSDGKLDLIIQANRNYEEERAILFLSSKAGKNQVLKKSAEIAIQFDC